MQRESIPRSLAAIVLSAALAAVTPLRPVRGAPPPQLPHEIDWRPAPEYVALFVPRVHREAYATFVTPLAIERVLERLAADPSLLRPPGAWVPRWVPPLDAFGASGAYDRTLLARLYGGRQPVVARGPVRAAGRGQAAGVPDAIESWTLVSPHPDPSLRRLMDGTLRIVLRLEPARAR